MRFSGAVLHASYEEVQKSIEQIIMSMSHLVRPNGQLVLTDIVEEEGHVLYQYHIFIITVFQDFSGTYVCDITVLNGDNIENFTDTNIETLITEIEQFMVTNPPPPPQT